MLSRFSLSPSPSKFSSLSLVLFAVLRDQSPNRYSSLVGARQFETFLGDYKENNGRKGGKDECREEVERMKNGFKKDSPSKGPAIESIAVKRLKDLCGIKEPTLNVGIDMVGAANLLKSTRYSSCREIQRAKEQAEKAADVLSEADRLRDEGVQLLSESQRSFQKLL